MSFASQPARFDCLDRQQRRACFKWQSWPGMPAPQRLRCLRRVTPGSRFRGRRHGRRPPLQARMCPGGVALAHAHELVQRSSPFQDLALCGSDLKPRDFFLQDFFCKNFRYSARG